MNLDWRPTVDSSHSIDGTSEMKKNVWKCMKCGLYRNYTHGEVFNPPSHCNATPNLVRRDYASLESGSH